MNENDFAWEPSDGTPVRSPICSRAKETLCISASETAAAEIWQWKIFLNGLEIQKSQSRKGHVDTIYFKGTWEGQGSVPERWNMFWEFSSKNTKLKVKWSTKVNIYRAFQDESQQTANCKSWQTLQQSKLQNKSLFLDLLTFNLHIRMFACTYVSIPHGRLLLAETRRECWLSWNCSYRWL